MSLLTKSGAWIRRVTAPPPELAPKDMLTYIPSIPEEPKVIRTYYLMGVSYANCEWTHIPQGAIQEFVELFNKPDEHLPYGPHVQFYAKVSRGGAYTYTASLFGEKGVGTFRIAHGNIHPNASSKAVAEGRAVTFTNVDIDLTAGKHRGLSLAGISVMITPWGQLVAIDA